MKPERSQRSTGRHVVALGGGTGLAALLRGLKRRVGAELAGLTAIVAVTDDGGSSGRLRRDFGVLPPGDVRNNLAALADDTDLLTRLFQYRFAGGEGLEGHSFGNLFLAALTELTGDFPQAILTAERVLSVRGRILPATLDSVHLRGFGASGRVYEGETLIGRSGERLERIELVPAGRPAYPPALEAIAAADLVLLGPGSLYTSILPNLLFPEIAEALRATPAPVVLVLNLMTQPGETDGLDGLDHLGAIESHLGAGIVDAVLVHGPEIAAERLAPYREEGAERVPIDASALRARGLELLEADLLAAEGLVRHDPDKLARKVVALLERP
ncbi:MAG TPA: gluconeogenesis factor YvcK family protein [Thermoanaerobaculia bacterium]|nr:gluconeogenesis factor YvcK family protein [Thermoanaerobaculia bacterium]